MPDLPDVAPQPQGLLPSLFNELNLGGYAVRNVLMGNFSGAGSNIIDALTNLIPTHPIAPVSTAADRPDFQDVANQYGLNDIGGDTFQPAVNFIGDIATDPVSYIPGAAFAKAGQLAGRGAQAGLQAVGKIPGLSGVPDAVNTGLSKAGSAIRSTFGAQTLRPEIDNAKAAAIATGQNVASAGVSDVAQVFKDSTQAEQEAVGHIRTGIRPALQGEVDASGNQLRYAPIDPSGSMDSIGRAKSYLQEHPELDPKRVMGLVEGTIAHSQRQAAEASGLGEGGNVFTADGLSQDYFPHRYEGTLTSGDRLMNPDGTEMNAEQLLAHQGPIPEGLGKAPVSTNPDDILGGAGPLKERTLLTAQQKADFLNANPNVNLEFNAAKALGARAMQQGGLATKAALGKGIFQLAQQGKVPIPESALEAAYQRHVANQAKPPVPPGAAASGLDMLAGVRQSPVEPLVGDISGVSRPGAGHQPIDFLSGLRPQQPADLVGDISGTAKAGASNEPIDLLGGIKPFQQDLVPEISGVSKPPGKLPEIESNPESLTSYGVGVPSGLAKPPASGSFASVASMLGGAPNAIEDAMRLSGQEGKSAVGQSGEQGALDLLSGLGASKIPGAMPVGAQSGKAIAGSAMENVAPDMAGKAPNLLEQAANLTGGQSGRAVVGPSTMPRGLSTAQLKQGADAAWKDGFQLADPEDKAMVNAIISKLPADEAKVLGDLFNGLPKRGAATQLLKNLNDQWKSYAVYGAIIPKLGLATRNLTGGIWRELTNAEARGNIGDSLVQMFPRWLASVDDGIEKLFGGRLFTENEFSDMHTAAAASGGNVQKMLENIRNPTLRDAVRLGVLENTQVGADKMLQAVQAQGWRKLFGNVRDYPAAVFQGTEMRIRWGLFKNLIAKGKTAEEAANICRTTFFNYHTSSLANRTARDIVPFFQFTAKAIPQAAKFFAEKPIAAAAVAQTYNTGNQQTYPYMDDRSNINLGPGEDGKGTNFLSGLSLPYESLGWLPNPLANPHDIGRQVEQTVVGSMNPALKSALELTFGRDAFFDSTYGSYSKVGGIDMGPTGQVLNEILGAGLGPSQAIASPLAEIAKATNDKLSPAERIANLLTGLHVINVDPDQARMQRLQDNLTRNPDVRAFPTFKANDPNSESAAMVKELQDLKNKQQKERREAIASAK